MRLCDFKLTIYIHNASQRLVVLSETLANNVRENMFSLVSYRELMFRCSLLRGKCYSIISCSGVHAMLRDLTEVLVYFGNLFEA